MCAVAVISVYEDPDHTVVPTDGVRADLRHFGARRTVPTDA